MKKTLILAIIFAFVAVIFSSCMISTSNEPEMPNGVYECVKSNGAINEYDFKNDGIVIQKIYLNDGTLVSTSKAEYMITPNTDGTYLFQTVSEKNGYVVNHEMEISEEYLLIDGEKYYKAD